jgi:hypothetical protein
MPSASRHREHWPEQATLGLLTGGSKMKHSNFDDLARTLTGGASRRSVLRRTAVVASGVATAAFGLGSSVASGQGNGQKKKNPKKKKQNQAQGNAQGQGGGCRGEGHPCEGNQVCCAGLACIRSGPGNALRCTAQGSQPAQGCPGQCPPTTQVMVSQEVATMAAPPVYWIETSCTFDAPAYQSICTCWVYGQPTAPRVQTITLPAAEVCAVVLREEFQASSAPAPAAGGTTGNVQASAGTGGQANADASGGQVAVGDVQGDNTSVTVDASGGTANADASGGDGNVVVVNADQEGGTQAAQPAEIGALTLTLAGEVVPGRPATYWLDTDAGRRPAPGPALVQVADQSAGTGAIIVEAMGCAIPQPQEQYDWFGQCTTPATGMVFGLYAPGDETAPVATLEVNEQGRAQFGGLAPGAYQLRPEGTNWCYAEGNRIDENGAVLVEADGESRVWGFVCTG